MGTTSRLRYVHFPLNSKELHLSVVNEVKAKSQSKSLSEIEHLLNAKEIDLIRRARNKTKNSQSLQTQAYTQEQLDLKPLSVGYF